jgi:2-oxoglutarate ferredoxin oxidoreductase subunit delta
MASGRITIDQDRCKGCELCLWACPPGVIVMGDKINSLGYRPAVLQDPDGKCTGCALCAMVCPDAVITVYRYLPAPRQRESAMEAA